MAAPLPVVGVLRGRGTVARATSSAGKNGRVMHSLFDLPSKISSSLPSIIESCRSTIRGERRRFPDADLPLPSPPPDANFLSGSLGTRGVLADGERSLDFLARRREDLRRPSRVDSGDTICTSPSPSAERGLDSASSCCGALPQRQARVDSPPPLAMPAPCWVKTCATPDFCFFAFASQTLPVAPNSLLSSQGGRTSLQTPPLDFNGEGAAVSGSEEARSTDLQGRPRNTRNLCTKKVKLRDVAWPFSSKNEPALPPTPLRLIDHMFSIWVTWRWRTNHARVKSVAGGKSVQKRAYTRSPLLKTTPLVLKIDF